MTDISNFTKDIAKEMKKTNELAAEANKLVVTGQFIGLAQHLGKTEMLEALLLHMGDSINGMADAINGGG